MDKLKELENLVNGMKAIKFICERAKMHEVEEKDIDDILKIIMAAGI